MPPQKGKQATKGQKQIVQENKETLKFYATMAIATEVLYSIVLIIFFWEEFSFYYWMVIGLTVAVYVGNLQFMNYMAKAVYSESGALLDGGVDLNMESGLAEGIGTNIICESLKILNFKKDHELSNRDEGLTLWFVMSIFESLLGEGTCMPCSPQASVQFALAYHQAPGRAFYLLWVNILGPWIFQPPPEVDEKKQKKLERKAKRH
ncbi:transmembrane protein 208-like [Limulus polyphemus]|uniref:Transmembrane protein 208 n=1 Tax=Limulus polyphemus TaxID=6850 RepID=A0ABM1C582_LIMPO|nr:transmembrane protein 208-like [Limulus polyphemus]